MNHHNASLCVTCGTSLSDIQTKSRTSQTIQQSYDFRYGETDLLEKTINPYSKRFMLLFTGIIGFLLLGIGYWVSINLNFGASSSGLPIDVPTNTPRPTIQSLATVTQGPSTPTVTLTPSITPSPLPTATREPCTQRVVQGDSLIGIVIRCGHQTRDIIPTVLELNGIQDESRIQVGETIIVPWPTPTTDPNAVPTDTPEGETNNSDSSDTLVSLANDPFAPTATPTLLPGVMWHRIQTGENVVSVAFQFGADVKVLSELNPEIDFAQCDFGETYGGPECVVQLFEGQLMRVPAPTPTPTIPPTLSGSETPTPTATATFNAPSAISPENLTFFGTNEQVTLRWIGSATLAENQTYRVKVENITSGNQYTADTTEIFYILPDSWQGNEDQRYTYNWTVSVINLDEPQNPLFSTESRTFDWQGQAGE